jgi:hypothetical protein
MNLSRNFNPTFFPRKSSENYVTSSFPFKISNYVVNENFVTIEMNKMEKIIIYSQEENNEKKKKEISNEIREEKKSY